MKSNYDDKEKEKENKAERGDHEEGKEKFMN